MAGPSVLVAAAPATEAGTGVPLATPLAAAAAAVVAEAGEGASSSIPTSRDSSYTAGGLPTDFDPQILAVAAGSAVEAELSELEEPPCPDYSQLPEACWQQVLRGLVVRDLCAVSRTCSSLKALAGSRSLWAEQYIRLCGQDVPQEWSGATIKRLCRRSELRAARWLDAVPETSSCGAPGTSCLQLDDSKVVSGDGSLVRLWSHDTGRRIATLSGHTGGSCREEMQGRGKEWGRHVVAGVKEGSKVFDSQLSARARKRVCV